ncbi:hypothetical protein TYRP_006539 [Tyrophagus putrescentiae]|nr:hypothetical protein TYRP_006539 [Tyrophagus putrescentiae]
MQYRCEHRSRRTHTPERFCWQVAHLEEIRTLAKCPVSTIEAILLTKRSWSSRSALVGWKPNSQRTRLDRRISMD